MENLNPDFLKEKYNLHNAPEVGAAAKRTEERTGEKVPQNPKDQIQNYLDRFTEIIERKEPGKRERGIEAIKRVIDDKYIIKPEEIPESYYENQRRIAREQGHGDVEITDEARNQLQEVIIKDQKDSLDNWIDYLSSKDATYPDWLKYFAIRNLLGMGEYDKEKKQFTKRSKGTVKPFPDINREALAYVLDAIEKKHKGIPNDKDPEFQALLQGENFAKLYAWAIDKATPESEKGLTNIKGEWVKYRQGKDHMPLVESLQGHGTGWCTAGESTAKAQLEGGDFYVYYSEDKNGKSNIPRAAIRMQGDEIGEVRGIGPDQNLDPYIGDVVKKKLTEFSDGPKYEKKVADMKFLTQIENKTKLKQPLGKEELIFLYEINNKIEGFGYQRDPRIKEVIDQRNPKEDAPIVFECQPEQIAYSEKEIKENTKAYIGPLFKNIFQTNIEHIYTFFPESSIKKMEAEIGGKTKKELMKEMEKNKVWISNYAKSMIDNPDFTTSKKQEHLNLVRISVKDLGFPNGAKTDKIYKKAQGLGLELCPAEVGPQLRLQYLDQPNGDWFYIGMKQISDSDGDPSVFDVFRNGDGRLELSDIDASPDRRWSGSNEFVFSLSRK